MIKLYGFPVSNYTNMVELALLEKGIPYEYVLTFPDQSPALMAKSPRGKVPFVETPHGFINEASAILEYLEESGEGRPLLPKDPYARSQVRTLMKEMELYIEWPARTCFAEAYFETPLPEAIKKKAGDDLKMGYATLGRHGRFAPYVAGSEFTLADITFLYTVTVAGPVAKHLLGRDPLAEMPAAQSLLARLSGNPHVVAIQKKTEAGRPAFIAGVKARLQAGR